MYPSIAILAGGNSSRFGCDKALTKLAGKEIIKYIIDEFINSANIYIIAKKNNKYRQLNIPIVIDTYSEQLPLIGIITALEKINSEFIFVIPADMPFIRKDMLEVLVDNIDNESEVILPRINGKMYPLTALYKRSVKETLEYYYKNGLYKLIDILSFLNVKILDESYFNNLPFSSFDFININTKSDYEYATQIIKEINKKI
jgi:molybdopterin-guanine dinucleotide biosynthesis protein A